MLVDDLNEVAMVYGGMLDEYDHGAMINLPRVDSLRVPYRLIPVYKANNLEEIRCAVELFLDFRQRELFHLLALGLAQHYGLPSVGLDLTDDLKVALWFAIYKATYSSKKPVKAELVKDEDNEATIFVFRCHPRSVYRYSDLVKGIGAHRPDAQRAYFNYCGWGLAKNQLALDLACAFRVDASFVKELPDNYIRYLFPSKENDEVLRILLQIKDMYQGTELGEMMEKIYL